MATNNQIKIGSSEGIIKVDLVDEEDKKVGELTFDIEDIELPLKVQKVHDDHLKNLNALKIQFAVIDKKEDHKGKKLLSFNEEQKIKAMKEYYQKEMETLDILLGEGGTEKLLAGRKPYYFMFDDIMKQLEQITPLFDEGFKHLEEKVKNKYKDVKSEENILE